MNLSKPRILDLLDHTQKENLRKREIIKLKILKVFS